MRGGAARPRRRSAAREPDLAVVFASGAHLAAPRRRSRASRRAVEPRRSSAAAPAACSAPAASSSREPRWPCGPPRSTTAATVTPVPRTGSRRRRRPWLDGLPELDGASGVIMLSDPYTFPTDAVLCASSPTRRAGRAGARRARRAPGRDEGTGALFFGEEVCADGAVGVRCDGVEMLPCVSQGAAPLGPRGDDHGGRGQRDPRARRPPGARDGRADHRRAVAARAGADRRRAADRDRDRRRQARVRAGRLPRPRRARRRPRLRRARRRRGRASGTGRAAARPRRAFGRRGPAPRAPRCGSRRWRATRRRARSCSPATAAGSAMFGPGDHDAAMVAARARRRPGGRVLRRRRDRAGGRAQLPARRSPRRSARVPGSRCRASTRDGTQLHSPP